MDDDQQFCLRWNNHQSTLVSVFDTLLEKGMHVDCTLAAEGQTLKAHKVVLSACSPYFESVLSQQYDKHPIIILKDVKYAELRAMMDYMYRGEVNISQDQLAALLKAAESLQIKGLSDNKPSRPPSRPAPPPPPPPAVPVTHVSRPPNTDKLHAQPRDESVDSREGSTSPSRRRKKPRRNSTEVPLTLPTPLPPTDSNGDDTLCKEEPSRDGVEDLTIDEEADDSSLAHNDVVRNFQWHMERSQDELMNSNDGMRDSQGLSPSPKPTIIDNDYIKCPHPLTRGFLKTVVKVEPTEPPLKEINRKRKYKIKKTNLKYKKVQSKKVKDDRVDFRYVCAICKKKKYKYKRNKLRHEKYECNKAPQFVCEICGRRYSQNKTLISHIALKHKEKSL